MPAPYTDESALEYSRQIAPALGLTDDQLPRSIFAAVLNGLAECQAVLDALTEQRSPVPITQLVAEAGR